MRLIFAGTPEFATQQLHALVDGGHEVVTVLTQPDRPRGRGLKLLPSPVKQAAQALHLPLLQPENLKDPALWTALADLGADAMVVAAYGVILPEQVLRLFPLGCINVHASLLPRWRGAAPIQRAILAGDSQTGITIMQMDPGLDTGDMLMQAAIPIEANDTAQTLHDRLAALGGRLLIQTLEALQQGGLVAVPQDDSAATYAEKLQKQEARLDWTQPAALIDRAIRAYNPFPVAWTKLQDERVRIFTAHLSNGTGASGQIIACDAKGILVACGEDALLIDSLQLAGGKRLDAAQAVQHLCNKGSKFD